MLDIILQILSIIGIIILVLLIIILFVLLLVLFFPITYKFYGSKTEDIIIRFNAKWLLGLLRVYYEYPEQSTVKVKVLWHTLYQKKIPQDSTETDAAETKNMDNVVKEPIASGLEMTKVPQETESVSLAENTPSEAIEPDAAEESPSSNKILKKIEKIKYTISNIYDKIKEIWENITYYAELLKEENTKVLFRHVTMRVGKILRSIRPRHLKADIMFGTGSPDTTGYAYGVYGMLSAVLGPKVIVVPDFEQAIFEGELQFSGHITVWVLLINALKLFFDPKLHLFIEKVKAGMPKKEK